MVRVSWEDAQDFIRKLEENESTNGHEYRSPTEAKREHAALATLPRCATGSWTRSLGTSDRDLNRVRNPLDERPIGDS